MAASPVLRLVATAEPRDRKAARGSAEDQLAAMLDAEAAASGNPAIARAARALRQPASGRPAIDDRAALAEAKWLITTGRVRSERAACSKVARTICKDNPDAVADRLRRKLRDERKKVGTK